MSELSVEARVRATIARTFRLSETDAQGDLRMSDPPVWNSLGHMDLIASLEKEFGVRFPGRFLAELTSVSSIVAALGKLGTR